MSQTLPPWIRAGPARMLIPRPAKFVGDDGGLAMMAGWDMTLAGWLWMLIWIAALLVMVWLIVRRPDDRPGAEDAMAILRSRFARGEISQEEFERARTALLADQREFTR